MGIHRYQPADKSPPLRLAAFISQNIDLGLFKHDATHTLGAPTLEWTGHLKVVSHTQGDRRWQTGPYISQ